ncbi:MAG: AmmeMemoRadiSam system radical SAM enzyme [Acetomicrobium flavidum]|uniref:AmmeMemoRadiSam system radical SAM enzyme n=1 Tax=Acetomicrobium flavidum TaxID=49896 RepID=UPI0016AB4BCB|nr:AmmeMemoRadiSam system radical SAM enzyme [Acetomicrobium flavidum]
MRALYWHWEDENVRCDLCPRGCLIPSGKRGLCRVREHVPNEGLEALTYGMFSSVAMDPMEKKPLYHFLPGKPVLSLGSVGCNMSCPFCQNWHISTWVSQIEMSYIGVDELISLAKKYRSGAVAFTYNEPLICFEYLSDAMPALKKEGIRTVLVTNGLINSSPLKDLLPHVNAANVDLKAFDESTYRKLGGDLKIVQSTLKSMVSCNVHVEITHLLVTGINDDLSKFEKMCSWIAGELGKGVPLHISRYFPAYKWNKPPTDILLLKKAKEIALRYLNFVYLGNVPDDCDTHCPGCGKLAIKRSGYDVKLLAVNPDGTCPGCGSDLGIVLF